MPQRGLLVTFRGAGPTRPASGTEALFLFLLVSRQKCGRDHKALPVGVSLWGNASPCRGGNLGIKLLRRFPCPEAAGLRGVPNPS